MAGYSSTPLLHKLGVKPEMKLLLVKQPVDYFTIVGADLSEQLCKQKDIPDLVHVFVKSQKEFEAEMKKLKSVLSKNPKLMIWVSWYKKSSGMSTDLTEDVIRNYALKNDLVDVKVCAVTDIWSGLKLVVPLAKR
jgi:hypothetical protein